MTEEEKKSIKYFNNFKATIDESDMLFGEEFTVKHGEETKKQITIILNLINKLQKENEKLKEAYQEESDKYFNLIKEIPKNFIPIREIKELIKRKKENIEGLHPASDCMLIDDYETQIDVLEQLLEEDNYDE